MAKNYFTFVEFGKNVKTEKKAHFLKNIFLRHISLASYCVLVSDVVVVIVI